MGKSVPKAEAALKAKKASSAGTQTKGTSEDSLRKKVLRALLQSYKCGQAVNDEKLAKLCSCHVRTKSYIVLKKTLEAEGIMERSSGGFVMTDSGAEKAGFVKEDLSKFTTDSEYHDYIKSILTKKWKSAEIFDLLLKDGPMRRTDLSGTIGINDRSHSFSYGLKELKDLGYAAKGNSNLWELTKKAFFLQQGM